MVVDNVSEVDHKLAPVTMWKYTRYFFVVRESCGYVQVSFGNK